MFDLKKYFPVAEAISLILYPHAEVVLHDLKTGGIRAIFNNFSKRKVGDESLLEEVGDFTQLPDVFPVYLKTNWDGRKIKSITATLRDQQERAIGLLCINLDLSKWEEFQHFLESWFHNPSLYPQPQVLFKDDWREKINTYISNFLNNERTTLKMLSKEKKRALIYALHQEGAFKAKNAASYIADVLTISRATIYNYLKAQND